MNRLRKDDIRRLFVLLHAELAAGGVSGELYLVGGVVMCLALNARDATANVDGLFLPARAVREAAARVAVAAVKGYLSPRGEFDEYLELAHLRVFTARPEYLLAMKCSALRLGERYHDLDDVRFLLRYLNITTADDAMEIVTRYFDERQLVPKTRLALEELLIF